MKTSDIRNLVITGSYYIGEDGIEDAHGWKIYALKLEEILIKNNGVLPIVGVAKRKVCSIEKTPNSCSYYNRYRGCVNCPKFVEQT